MRDDADRLARAHHLFGWSALFLSFLLGALIEGMLGIKSRLILDPLRHELWTLAHFHGAFFGLLNLLYPLVVRSQGTLRRWTSFALMIGSVALPAGFLLGGIGHPEGDPSAGIVLAPIGALLVAIVALDHAVRAWRGLTLVIVFLGCASTPSPLLVDIQGQVVGSSVRELIVNTRNGGSRAEDIVVEIDVPPSLILPAGMTTGSMTCERGDATIRCAQRVAPETRAVVRVPIANRMGEIEVRAWTARHPEQKVVERRSLALAR